MDDKERVSSTSPTPEIEELIKSDERLNDSTVSYTTCMNSTINCSSISTDDDHQRITNIYLCCLCVSPILHVLDVGTDTYLAYQYCLHGEYSYFLCTMLFVAMPAVISTLFSIHMYLRDSERVSRLRWTFRSLLLILQISPVIRYLEALQHALVLKRGGNSALEYRKHSTLLLKEDSNLALLRILECFLEAAPQQVLQITILLTPGRSNMPTILQVYLYLALLTSFLSTSWTFAMYHRSIRFAQKNKVKMSWIATIVQFSWIFSMMTSRILAISEAASVYPKGTLIVCIIHWFIMTVWLSAFEQTWFCFSHSDPESRTNKFKDVLFCAVMGLVYIFSYVAVNDKPTRYRYLFYYSICFLENCLSIIAWILASVNGDTWWFWVLPTIIFCTFAVGLVMMFVYYSCFHPKMGYETKVMSLPNIESSPSVEKKEYLNCTTQTTMNRS